jgi:hypothetical protein
MKTNADLIHGKLMGELGDSDLEKFDRLLADDEEFAKEYNLAKQLTNYLANEKLFSFRSQVMAIGDQYQLKPHQKFQLPQWWKYAASVAAVGILMFSLYFFINNQNSNQQLFEQYYNADEVYLNTRSGAPSSTDVLEQGLLLFENDQYQESIDYFEQLPTSVTAIYYSGVAHMEIGEYEVAEFKFDQVISDYLNVFYDQAQWYKALCLLKQNKNKNANLILQNIAKSDSYYKNQAEELARKLK